MKRYIPCGCSKCDFSEGQRTYFCKSGFCNLYEEGYIVCETDVQIGCSSLEEFNKVYGTDYKEIGDYLVALGDGIGRNEGINHWSQSRQNDYYRGVKDFIEWLLSYDKYAACTIDTDDNCIVCDAGLVEDIYTVSADELFKEFQRVKDTRECSKI